VTELRSSDLAADIPPLPGCYIFRDRGDAALYVGKARDLRARVRSYFRDGGDGRPLIPYLFERAARIETIITKTESEAILLEDTLIKKLKPPFNLRLKDDKAFFLLRLDPASEFPRLEWVRRRRADRALYFGPYASAGALRRTIRFLHTIIPLRDCSDHILRNRTRPCLKHAIGRCSAPCVGLIAVEDYKKLVDRAVDLLQGRTQEAKKLIEQKMAEAAQNLEFERAARWRDALQALETTTESQGVRLGRSLDRDVFALEREGGRIAMQFLPFRGGRLEGGRIYQFTTDLPDDEVFNSLLTQVYAGDAFVPREIYTSHVPHDAGVLAQWLSKKRGADVHLAVAKSGDAKRAVQIAAENARAALQSTHSVESSLQDALRRMGERVELQEPPSIVDCFDISTLQGRSTVASRVRFVDGVPDRAGYRRYKITSFAGQDDFAAMHEVVLRSLKRDVEESSLPDLVVIDGGLGQLGSALAAREEAGAFDVAIVSLAKDRVQYAGERSAHSGERLFIPGRSEPVLLNPRSSEHHLLTRLRDEAHRFAITFHRKQRESIRSELDAIPGVGPARRRELLSTFGSVERVRSATPEEILQKIRGFPRALAEAVARELSKNAAAPVSQDIKKPGEPDPRSP
jgi:excinuclease ABC subunit C